MSEELDDEGRLPSVMEIYRLSKQSTERAKSADQIARGALARAEGATDEDTKLHLLRTAANLGSTDAMFALAQALYEEGDGEAVRWLKRAVAEGGVRAHEVDEILRPDPTNRMDEPARTVTDFQPRIPAPRTPATTGTRPARWFWWTRGGLLVSVVAALLVWTRNPLVALAVIAFRLVVSTRIGVPGVAQDESPDPPDMEDRWIGSVKGHVADQLILLTIAATLLRDGHDTNGLFVLVCSVIAMAGTLTRVGALELGIRQERSFAERVYRNGSLVIAVLGASQGDGLLLGMPFLSVAGIGAALYGILEWRATRAVVAVSSSWMPASMSVARMLKARTVSVLSRRRRADRRSEERTKAA